MHLRDHLGLHQARLGQRGHGLLLVHAVQSPGVLVNKSDKDGSWFGSFIKDFKLYCDLLEYPAEDHHLVVLVQDVPEPSHRDTLQLIQSCSDLLFTGLDSVEDLRIRIALQIKFRQIINV